MSVLIADDHEVVRRGIRALIHEQPGWQVVAEATAGRDAVAKAEECAGACGYILKADAGRDLITAVRALLANRTFFTPKVAQKVKDGHLDKVPKASAWVRNTLGTLLVQQRD